MLLLAFDHTDDQCDHGDGQEHEKQDFCDFDRAGSDAAEAEHRGDQCDHEKNRDVLDPGFNWR